MNDFPSTLIIGENYLPLLKSLGHESIQNPDLFIIDDNTGYKIENIRQINNFLQNLPYNHQNKFVLIKNIENLEIVAQNALLKNLEEPGNNNYFVLTTNNLSKILPTIISRCHLINQKNIDTNKLIFPKLLNETEIKDIKSALQISSTIEKNNIKETLLNELTHLQQELIKNQSEKLSNKIKTLLKSLDYIDSNLDPRLALDYYLLKSEN